MTRPAASHASHWTPARGLCRAIVWGGLFALALAVLLTPAAVLAPMVVGSAVLRFFITVAVAWAMFGIVQSAAGMTGGLVTWLAATLTLLVMISNHIGWAIWGMPTSDADVLIGWSYWFDPMVIAIGNMMVTAALVVVSPLFHDGAPGGEFFGEVASQRLWWT